MRLTPTYKLEYCEAGDFYSRSSDFRRFATLEYNLSTYVGMIGDGIIQGWELSFIPSGTVIGITSGAGFVNGLICESPFVKDVSTNLPKRLSQIDPLTEVVFQHIPGYSDPTAASTKAGFYDVGSSPPELVKVVASFGPDSETTPAGAIQRINLGNPPEGYLNDPFVKAYLKSVHQVALPSTPSNADYYIYALRTDETNPVAVGVTFHSVLASSSIPAFGVLLGKALVRGGVIQSIVYDDVFWLDGAGQSVSSLAQDLISGHHHGGGTAYDPPRISLTTDIRPCYPFTIDSKNSTVTYKAYATKQTGASSGHYHTFDMQGTLGVTEDVVGGGIPYHVHSLSLDGEGNLIVSASSSSLIAAHTHAAETSPDPWIDGSPVRVLVNGSVINSGYTVDAASKSIKFDNKTVSIRNAVYSTSFQINAKGDIYTYKQEGTSLYNFLLKMQSDFYAKYGAQIDPSVVQFTNVYDTTKTTTVPNPTIRDPFTFSYDDLGNNIESVLSSYGSYVVSSPVPIYVNPTGNAATLSGIRSWFTDAHAFSAAASKKLLKAQDSIEVGPYSARFITVVMEQAGYHDSVTIEILSQAEVTGVLSSDRILFVDAGSLALGQFSIAQIPFLSHVGRLNEIALPTKASSYTGNYTNFYAIPTYTSTVLGHSHKVYVDRSSSGDTLATLIDGDLKIFVDQNGTPVNIVHAHGITDGVLEGVAAAGINQWQGTDPATTHTHTLDFPSPGNSQTVFSLGQDASGDWLAGGSNGLSVLSSGLIYRVYVGNAHYNFYGVSAMDAVTKALVNHASLRGEYITLPNQDAISIALRSLDSDGSNVTIQGSLVGYSILFQGTKITVPKSIPVNIFAYKNLTLDDLEIDSVRTENSISEDDIVLQTFDVLPQSNITSESSIADLVQAVQDVKDYKAQVAAQSKVDSSVSTTVDTVKVYRVLHSYNGEPVCSVSQNANGMGFYAATPKSLLFRDAVSQNWTSFFLSASASIIRKVIQDSNDNVWAASNLGLFVMPSDQSLMRQANYINRDKEVYDVVEVARSTYPWIAAAASDGVYVSKDEGSTWVKKQSSAAVKFLTRDYALDRTSLDSGHLHYLIVDQNGNGTTTDSFLSGGSAFIPLHAHEVIRWVVQPSSIPSAHTHSIISTLAFVDELGAIYRSVDSGETWVASGSLPLTFGEIGPFASAFGNFYAASASGLLMSSDFGTTWSTMGIFDKVHSFGWSFDFASVSIGGENNVYLTGGSNVTLLKSFGQFPSARVYQDGEVLYFGYSYSNNSAGFFFQNPPPLHSSLQYAVSYSKWVFPQHGWDSLADYELFLGSQKVIDTKNNVDLRKSLGLNFSIDPVNGEVDFTVQTSLAAAAGEGSRTIFVHSNEGFVAGSVISIVSFLGESQSTDSKIIASAKVSSERAIVQGLSGANALFLTAPISQDLPLSSTVILVPNVGDDFQIRVNIYDSPLYNVGKLSHLELEDSVSLATAGSPMALSNVGYSNFSEISLSLKKRQSTIDEDFRRWRSYMMNFSGNNLDSKYIGNYFDITNSNLNSGTLVSTSTTHRKTSSINAVQIGSEYFAGLTAIGTDIGLFVAEQLSGWNGNWFWFVPAGIDPVNGILFTRDESFYVVTNSGLYSTDLEFWKKNPIVSGTMNFIENRWKNFGGPDAGLWWKSWDGLINHLDPDVTNTLLVGGDNVVIYSNDNGVTWHNSSILLPSNTHFSATGFAPLSNGRAILLVNRLVLPGGDASCLMATSNAGDLWDSNIFLSETQDGNIVSIATTSDKNTRVVVTSNLHVVADNGYIGRLFKFGGKGFEIVGNYDNTVILRGMDAYSALIGLGKYSIEPLRLHDCSESPDGRIVVATSNGLLTDNGTLTFNNADFATILGTDKSAVVDSIDLSGSINSIYPGLSKTQIVCTLDHMVGVGELIGRQVKIQANAFPSLSVLNPTPGQVVTSSTINVSLAISGFDLSTGFVEVVMDGGAPSYFSSSQITLTGIPSGSRIFQFSLVDSGKKALSNAESQKTISVSVDYPSNTTSVEIVYPSSGQTIPAGNFNAVFKVQNFVTGVDGNLNYSIDGGAAVVVPAFGSGTTEVVIGALTDGQHGINAFLTDKNGAITTYSVSQNFTVATSGTPSIFLTNPVNNQPLFSSTFAVTYVISNFVLGSGSSKVAVIIDDKLTYYSTDPSILSISGLADGNHTVYAKLIDSAGADVAYASAKTATVAFNINTSLSTDPLVAITSPLAGSSVPEATSINIVFQALNFPEGGAWVQVNANPEAYVAITDTTAPVTYPISGIVTSGTTQPTTVAITLATNNGVDKIPGSTASISFIITKSSTVMLTGHAITTSLNQTPAQPSQILKAASASTSTTTSALDSAWTISDNSASAVGGDVSITVAGKIPLSFLGQSVRIVSKQGILYVTFNDPIKTGEFTGGKITIAPDEASNAGKTYTIVDQNESYVKVDAVLDPDSATDVSAGQKILFISADGTTRLLVDFSHSFGRNELVGTTISLVPQGTRTAVNGDSTALSSYQVVGNDLRTITLSSAAKVGVMQAGDSLALVTPVFTAVDSFNKTQTTTDLAHHHTVDLMGGYLTGLVANVNTVSQSLMDVFVNLTTEESNKFLSAVLVSNPSLLNGARIVFYDPADPSTAYEETVEGTTNDRIKVQINNANDWNTTNVYPKRISAGFAWKIDVRYYGQTSSPIPLVYTHTHLIRNGIISYEAVSGYTILGYPNGHSHAFAPLVADVVGLVPNYTYGLLTASGSSRGVYQTSSGDPTWQQILDLTDYTIPFSREVLSTCLDVDVNGCRLVGTNVGQVVAETLQGGQSSPLVNPFISSLLPSSSSSSKSSASSESSSSLSSSSQSSLSSSSSTYAQTSSSSSQSSSSSTEIRTSSSSSQSSSSSTFHKTSSSSRSSVSSESSSSNSSSSVSSSSLSSSSYLRTSSSSVSSSSSSRSSVSSPSSISSISSQSSKSSKSSNSSSSSSTKARTSSSSSSSSSFAGIGSMSIGGSFRIS